MQAACFGCKSTKDKIGVLIAQLGTPQAPTAEALYPYLKQFLSDRRVIEVNKYLWWFILNFSVLRKRPARSAALYARIWTKEGSPLLCITKSQTEKLEKLFSSDSIEFDFGMRYGQPSLESALDNLIDKGCSKILLFPMYPQYSASTSASTYDVVFAHLLKRRVVPTLRVAEPYYRHKLFIDCLSQVINQEMSKIEGQPEFLVLSYHGIPLSYVQKGDPYCCMCTETTAALLPKLNFPAERVIHTFQSRFGKDPWLTPYTDETIDALAEKGAKHIAIAAPGFTTDCLETLDELGNEALHAFREKGGEKISLIPCLNDHELWIEALKSMLEGEMYSWLQQDASYLQPCAVTCPLQAEVG